MSQNPNSFNYGPSLKPDFFSKFLGSQICEKASLARSTRFDTNLDNRHKNVGDCNRLKKLKNFAKKIAKKDSFSEGPYIVDSHCHLDLLEEKGLELEEILKNCAAKNVKILQTICTKFSEIDKILSYTKKDSSIYCSIGNHPCNVDSERFKKAEELIEICQNEERVIGIGETGLDYFHSTEHVALQKKFFIEHINVSCETDLPLIIHSRDCDRDMAEILISEQRNKSFPALLHCFSSSYELAKTALDLGIFISISGIVSFKNAKELQEIVKKLPLEFLLVETDSPYLAPLPHRGEINQPAYTSLVVQQIATLKNLPVQTVISQTTKNFHKLFLRAHPLTT